MSVPLGGVGPPRRRITIRLLIVDDYKDWRRRVRWLLQARPEWQIIGEASDGSEAVQKAEELKPDLILLDIGLPTLNGIEAARQIRRLVPESKIIFLSQESSVDVVQEALGLGAWGYVGKARAGSELVAAVDAVISEKETVSGTDKPEACAFAGGQVMPLKHAS